MACAPSTTVRMPAARARRTSSDSGRISAVGEVMWLKKSTRVRGVTPAHTASITSSADRIGRGTG